MDDFLVTGNLILIQNVMELVHWALSLLEVYTAVVQFLVKVDGWKVWLFLPAFIPGFDTSGPSDGEDVLCLPDDPRGPCVVCLAFYSEIEDCSCEP